LQQGVRHRAVLVESIFAPDDASPDPDPLLDLEDGIQYAVTDQGQDGREDRSRQAREGYEEQNGQNMMSDLECEFTQRTNGRVIARPFSFVKSRGLDSSC